MKFLLFLALCFSFVPQFVAADAKSCVARDGRTLTNRCGVDVNVFWCFSGECGAYSLYYNDMRDLEPKASLEIRGTKTFEYGACAGSWRATEQTSGPGYRCKSQGNPPQLLPESSVAKTFQALPEMTRLAQCIRGERDCIDLCETGDVASCRATSESEYEQNEKSCQQWALRNSSFDHNEQQQVDQKKDECLAAATQARIEAERACKDFSLRCSSDDPWKDELLSLTEEEKKWLEDHCRLDEAAFNSLAQPKNKYPSISSAKSKDFSHLSYTLCSASLELSNKVTLQNQFNCYQSAQHWNEEWQALYMRKGHIVSALVGVVQFALPEAWVATNLTAAILAGPIKDELQSALTEIPLVERGFSYEVEHTRTYRWSPKSRSSYEVKHSQTSYDHEGKKLFKKENLSECHYAKSDRLVTRSFRESGTPVPTGEPNQCPPNVKVAVWMAQEDDRKESVVYKPELCR